MTDIAAENVTYTIVKYRTKGDSRKHNLVKIAFGNASLTFPATGIPLTKGKMGCPTVIESVTVVDRDVDDFMFMYDRSAETLIAYNVSTTTGEHTVATNAPAATNVEVEVIGY